MRRQSENANLNDSGRYKSGIITESQDASMADAKQRAEQQYQQQLKEEKKQRKTEEINKIKNHAIPFSAVQTNFKIVFICSLVAFALNIILSFVFKDFLWSNIFNLISAVVIYFLARHVYVRQRDEIEEKVNSVIKQNICQIIGDIITYKLPKTLNDNSTKIADIVSVIAAICFALFSSQNILYALCAVSCLFIIILLTGLKQFTELESHLKMLNKSLLIGIFVKAILCVFVSKFIQIDYMNVILLFLFTGIKLWIMDNNTNTI